MTVSSFQKLQKEIHQQTVKMGSYEKENEVFKATYKGDMDLLKYQMQTQTEMMKEIVHKVNNIANIRVKDIVEQILDEKLHK